MDFQQRAERDGSNAKLEKMFENLTSITKQLEILQGFIESKYGQEFTTFCQLSEASSADPGYTSVLDTTSMQEDADEYDKMPNLVSEESPSRTLGFVSVPLRQSVSNGDTLNKRESIVRSSNNNNNDSGGISKRSRVNILKNATSVDPENDNDDMMYPLHNLSELLDDTGDVDANETPEFLEMELDPTTLLRGEPPALQPMFANANLGHIQQPCTNSNNNSNSSGKRSCSRHSSGSVHSYDAHPSRENSSICITRRASVGNPENNLSFKKFDCHVCGIKFEFAETLKTHFESHAGVRNIRSSSEDQIATGKTSSSLPLPKLMPRPSIPAVGSAEPTLDSKRDTKVKVSKSKKKKRARISSQSSLTSQTSMTSMKRSRRYNQSRPCALKCPECDLPIRDKSRLIEHIRGHTGERPFECSVCEKAYTRRDVLKTHMIKMHGITPDQTIKPDEI